MHGVTLEQDHNAHLDEGARGFWDCYQAVVHCESRAEARDVAQVATSIDELDEALRALDAAMEMFEDDDVVDIDMVVGDAHRSLKEALGVSDDGRQA